MPDGTSIHTPPKGGKYWIIHPWQLRDFPMLMLKYEGPLEILGFSYHWSIPGSVSTNTSQQCIGSIKIISLYNVQSYDSLLQSIPFMFSKQKTNFSSNLYCDKKTDVFL